MRNLIQCMGDMALLPKICENTPKYRRFSVKISYRPGRLAPKLRPLAQPGRRDDSQPVGSPDLRLDLLIFPGFVSGPVENFV